MSVVLVVCCNRMGSILIKISFYSFSEIFFIRILQVSFFTSLLKRKFSRFFHFGVFFLYFIFLSILSLFNRQNLPFYIYNFNLSFESTSPLNLWLKTSGGTLTVFCVRKCRLTVISNCLRLTQTWVFYPFIYPFGCVPRKNFIISTWTNFRS